MKLFSKEIFSKNIQKFRLIIFIGLALWLSTFILNNFLLDKQWLSTSNSYSYSPFYNETVVINGSDQIVYYQVSQYVHISPDKIHNFQVILQWTKYFSEDIMQQMRISLNDYSEHLLFRPKACFQKYPQCLITSDRSFLNTAKALIFHWRDLNENDMPIKNDHQLWTLYNLESPINTQKLPQSDNNRFNLTATYRQDSDIPIPYGKIIKRSNPLKINLEQLIDLGGKIKPIVWFVSNCNTQSKREIYVEKLSKFVQVDIYGACGKLKCPHSEKCYEKAARQYLFYLSFENSICKDYLTEKLFNVMNYDIVPIVYGGANYSELLPPGSYIDANLMPPKRLARLIIKIASSRKLYLKYFEWRKMYYVYTPDMNSDLFCKLCKILDEQQQQAKNSNKNIEALENRSKTWAEINHWYFDDVCQNPEI